VPLLAVVAVLEGFFLFAYNFETFGGHFHNNFWFAISWGALPLLSGYIMQTNSVNAIALVASAATGFVSYLEIKLSRPYKELKKRGENQNAKKLEYGLKALTVGTIGFAMVILAYKIILS